MFYWIVFYFFLFFYTYTTFITHYFDGILFPLCSNGFFVSIVLSNLTVFFFPHIISFSAMTPLPVQCSNCRFLNVNCNASLHVKGSCTQCHVDGVECLFPPPVILLLGPLSHHGRLIFQKNCVLCSLAHRRCLFDVNDQSSCQRCLKLGLSCAFRLSSQGRRNDLSVETDSSTGGIGSLGLGGGGGGGGNDYRNNTASVSAVDWGLRDEQRRTTTTDANKDVGGVPVTVTTLVCSPASNAVLSPGRVDWDEHRSISGRPKGRLNDLCVETNASSGCFGSVGLGGGGGRAGNDDLNDTAFRSLVDLGLREDQRRRMTDASKLDVGGFPGTGWGITLRSPISHAVLSPGRVDCDEHLRIPGRPIGKIRTLYESEDPSAALNGELLTRMPVDNKPGRLFNANESVHYLHHFDADSCHGCIDRSSLVNCSQSVPPSDTIPPP